MDGRYLASLAKPSKYGVHYTYIREASKQKTAWSVSKSIPSVSSCSSSSRAMLAFGRSAWGGDKGGFTFPV